MRVCLSTMDRVEKGSEGFSAPGPYLEKQEGTWRLMDFNLEVDGARVRTLGLKTNMSEIQNSRVVDVRLKQPLDMFIRLVHQASEDIAHSQTMCRVHDALLVPLHFLQWVQSTSMNSCLLNNGCVILCVGLHLTVLDILPPCTTCSMVSFVWWACK